MQRTESEGEKRERLEREREQMRQAVANYSGPITRCPQGKTSDPNWSGPLGHGGHAFGMLKRAPRHRWETPNPK